VRYASVCSGVDTFAHGFERVAERLGFAWRYVHAAEGAEPQRRVLAAAWAHKGLVAAAISPDARSAGASAAPPVDICIWSPPCSPFSRRSHKRCDGAVASGAAAASAMLGFVAAGRPAVVVAESVDEPDSVEDVTVVLSSLAGYSWYSCRLGAAEYGDGAMTRVRRIWVGVLDPVD